MAEQYGLDPEKIRDEVWMRIDGILQSKDPVEAHGLAKKVKERFQVTCLVHGTKKSSNPEFLEKEAKKAENLSKFLASKGVHHAAKQQKKRAESLRKAASQKKGKGD